MSGQLEVLEKKYVDLRERVVEEIDRVDARLDYYSGIELDSQMSEMQKKYQERRNKLFSELDKVDSRLQSYASMKKTQSKPKAIEIVEPKAQKMYRGRPVA